MAGYLFAVTVLVRGHVRKTPCRKSLHRPGKTPSDCPENKEPILCHGQKRNEVRGHVRIHVVAIVNCPGQPRQHLGTLSDMTCLN